MKNFKDATLKNYHDLAKHYALKLDAKEFLNRFCALENDIFMPLYPECKEFVQFYYDLYEKIGNEIDNSGAGAIKCKKILKNMFLLDIVF